MSLWDLECEKSDRESELSAKQQEQASYQQTASEIAEVYKSMADKKEEMIELREEIQKFRGVDVATFKGNAYETQYLPQADAIIACYTKMIEEIDANMDALNMAQCDYENKAYHCDGVIGYLESAINSLCHQITNWVN